MALRPGKQRLSATPIIAKGVLYPLQNPRASKLATHGFASKSDTRHNIKGTHMGAFCVGSKSSRCRTAHLARLLREGVVLREHPPSNRLQCTQAQNSVRKSGHPSQKKARLRVLFSTKFALRASEIATL